MNSQPDAYGNAFARLALFAAEEQDWDGQGGRPAPASVVADATAFLESAIQHDLLPPSLVLSTTGRVSAVWNRPGEVYIMALITGSGAYTYTISNTRSFSEGGKADTMAVDEYLLGKLVSLKFTMADDTPYRKAFAVLSAIAQPSKADPKIQAKVVASTRAFLEDALSKGLPEPVIHRRGYKAVMATWQDSNDWFIQAEIEDSAIYTYSISRCPNMSSDPGLSHPGVLRVGVSKSLHVAPELVEYLSQMGNEKAA